MLLLNLLLATFSVLSLPTPGMAGTGRAVNKLNLALGLTAAAVAVAAVAGVTTLGVLQAKQLNEQAPAVNSVGNGAAVGFGV